MIRLMIIGAVTAFVTALFFHLVLPAALGVVVAVLFSGATLLDPLYAGDRIETIWSTVGNALIIQTLHTFVTAVAAGVLIGYLSRRWQSGWFYLAGALLSLILHYCVLAIVAVGLPVLSAQENFGLVWGITLVIITIVAPLIGLVSALAVRSKKAAVTTEVED